MSGGVHLPSSAQGRTKNHRGPCGNVPIQFHTVPYVLLFYRLSHGNNTASTKCFNTAPNFTDPGCKPRHYAPIAIDLTGLMINMQSTLFYLRLILHPLTFFIAQISISLVLASVHLPEATFLEKKTQPKMIKGFNKTF